MRITLRRKQRWFHAVAITCLSGFALCGCARGTRDLSSNLQKNAEQEALEAERHVAERKRQDSTSASKILKERDFEEKAVAVHQAERKPRPETSADDPWGAAEARQGSQSVDASEDTYASEDDEGVIRTVSGSETAEDLMANSDTDTAEELFPDPSEDGETATEASGESEDVKSPFRHSEESSPDDSEGKVHIQKKQTPSSAAQRSRSANTLATARSGEASYRGTQEHPWSRKAPVVQRSEEESTSAQTAQPQAEDRTQAADSRMEESDAQIEAKARIRILVDQAKSLIKKGEYRSAYRAAQVAQRMAESSDVYFAAGEEQPADVVRAVLGKIRSQETPVASTSKRPAPKASQPETRTTQSKVVRKTAASNLPDGWAFAEWQSGTKELAATKTPEKSATKHAGVAGMRIQPSTRRRSETNAFPSGTDWKPQSENPVAQSSATTADDPSSEVVPAALPSDSLTGRSDRQANVNEPGGRLQVPRPFPKPDLDDQPATPAPPAIESPQLAVGQNWRNESLDTAGAGRMPLLVAPLPPQEPVADSLIEMAEEPLAVETDDLGKPASESKLWMLLAAAAGAFAMLFVRRRPAPVQVEPKAP